MLAQIQWIPAIFKVSVLGTEIIKKQKKNIALRVLKKYWILYYN